MIKHYIFLTILSFVVIGTVVYGLFDGGSPQAARDQKNDQTRSQHVQTLHYGVNSYFRTFKRLPDTIPQIVNNQSGLTSVPTDPESGAAYEYTVVDSQNYSICGTFSTDTRSSNAFPKNEGHPKGHYCYSYNVNN